MNPTDEVQLAADALPFAAPFNGRIPTRAEIRSLLAQHGIDLTTRILYEIIYEGNHAFIHEIDQIEPCASPKTAAFKLLIVPALLYKEHPEFGGDGKSIAEIARACQIETDVVPVASRGSCAENIKILWQAIQHEPVTKIVLLTLSKGGAEARLTLEAHRTDAAMGKVVAWVNLCGFVNGSPLFDLFSGKLRARLISLVMGIDSHVADEMSSLNPHWSQPFCLADGLLTLNIIGMPLANHMQTRNQLDRYVRLAKLGPNDGFALSSEMLIPGSPTYPLWGADHYFRTPQVSPLLYRIFNYLKGKHQT
jgi:hypothetical protein